MMLLLKIMKMYLSLQKATFGPIKTLSPIIIGFVSARLTSSSRFSLTRQSILWKFVSIMSVPPPIFTLLPILMLWWHANITELIPQLSPIIRDAFSLTEILNITDVDALNIFLKKHTKYSLEEPGLLYKHIQDNFDYIGGLRLVAYNDWLQSVGGSQVHP